MALLLLLVAGLGAASALAFASGRRVLGAALATLLATGIVFVGTALALIMIGAVPFLTPGQPEWWAEPLWVGLTGLTFITGSTLTATLALLASRPRRNGASVSPLAADYR
jgi:hypothetical protein